jgi:hypothetical protein
LFVLTSSGSIKLLPLEVFKEVRILKYFISYLLEPISYLVLALSISFYVWRTSNNLKCKILAAYFIIATLLTAATLFLPRNTSNIVAYDILCLLTSVFLSVYFFYSLIMPWKKIVTLFLCLTQISYFVLSNIVFKSAPLFDSMGYVILSVCIVIMIFMYLHQILSNVTEESLSLNFDFWFVSSQLIYFLGSFIIFLTFNYLTRKILTTELYLEENRVLLTKLWGVHNVLLFLSSLLTLGSVIWIAFHKKLQSS